MYMPPSKVGTGTVVQLLSRRICRCQDEVRFSQLMSLHRRDEYSHDDLAGGSKGFFRVGRYEVIREDVILVGDFPSIAPFLALQIPSQPQAYQKALPPLLQRSLQLKERIPASLQTNPRGLKLQCSHFKPCHVRRKEGGLPCVIYCHCNSGSRRDAEEAICILVPLGVSVFAVDFSVSAFGGAGHAECMGVCIAVLHIPSMPCNPASCSSISAQSARRLKFMP